MKAKKRPVEILVLSDIHLGTYGCHAKELLFYLKSIKPGIVVLNGDIIDIWQFSKKYWPKSHMKVVKLIMSWVAKGIKVYYVTGNHDEMLRKFSGMKIGSLRIVNKVLLDLPDNKKAWIFHGDVFDVSMQHARWLAKLGAVGYDTLILINRVVNFISEKIFRKGKISLSKKIKNSVKSAVKFINNFEQVAADIAINNQYDYVICGHIHHPQKRIISNEKGSVEYLNSGDWIENLSALEYKDGSWNIYHFNEAEWKAHKEEDHEAEQDPANKDLFNHLVKEFNLLQ